MSVKKRKLESGASDAEHVCQPGNVNNLIMTFSTLQDENSPVSSVATTNQRILEKEAPVAENKTQEVMIDEATSFVHTPLKNINDAKENRKGLEEHNTLTAAISNLRIVGGGKDFNQPPIQLIVGPAYNYTAFGTLAKEALLHDFAVTHLDVDEGSSKHDAIDAQATRKKNIITHLQQVQAYFFENCSKKETTLLKKLPVRL